MILACVDVPTVPNTELDTTLNINNYLVNLMGVELLGMDYSQAFLSTSDQRNIGVNYNLNYCKKLMVVSQANQNYVVSLIKSNSTAWHVTTINAPNIGDYLNFWGCQTLLRTTYYRSKDYYENKSTLIFEAIESFASDAGCKYSDPVYIARDDSDVVDLLCSVMWSDYGSINDILEDYYTDIDRCLTIDAQLRTIVPFKIANSLGISDGDINNLKQQYCINNFAVNSILQNSIAEVELFYKNNSQKYYPPNNLLNPGYLCLLVSAINIQPCCKSYITYNFVTQTSNITYCEWIKNSSKRQNQLLTGLEYQLAALIKEEIKRYFHYDSIAITITEARQVVVQVLNQTQLVGFTIIDLDVLSIGSFSMFPKWMLNNDLILNG